MGQEQSSGANIANQQPQKNACRPCGDWGNKDYSTVKIDAAALGAFDKENAPNGNAVWKKSKEEQEGQEREAEAARLAEEQRRVEEQRREMERRVKEEQERQLAEQHRREAERRQIQLEQAARERDEKERVLEMRRQGELFRQQQEKEREEKIRLQEEARQKKIKDMADQKKVRAWLHSNGFKNVNDLVRKRFTKVTPLHLAVGQNHPDMITLLLAAGADPKQMNGKSETALRLAQKLDNKGSHAAILQAFAAK